MNYELQHRGILDMKWGIRRYQNKDGSLTPAGRIRYAKDKMANDRKKRKDRAEEYTLKDPDRWVREDFENTRRVTDEGSKVVRQFQDIEKKSRREPSKPERMDLSSMDDQELRQRINRELMEQQYNKLMNEVPEPTVSKGRKVVQYTLETAGSVLALGTSALSIALAVQQLKGSSAVASD